MKKKVFTIFLLLSLVTTFAQKEVPAFGKIDKADLLLTECEFDKDAEAYKLLDYGNVNYHFSETTFSVETERRIRIKILKEKGIAKANIKLRFYSRQNYESINKISALTYNIDNSGNIVTTNVDKSSIYTKKIDDHFSEIVFTMPEVKIGSVIEYKFVEIKKTIGNLDDWYFQDYIPTRLSFYKMSVPSVFIFNSEVKAYQDVEEKNEYISQTVLIRDQNVNMNSTVKTYILRNIPALRNEPYMGALKDYLQRVEFQLSQIDFGDGRVQDMRSTWLKLTNNLLADEDFGLQLKKILPHTKSFGDSVANIKSDYGKMILIHDYVRKNMNWNGNQSLFSENGIKSAWDKKSGNNTDLNLILINLLREAGLMTYPLLVSTKDNGTVNRFYPFLQQFNNTMTCVFIGNKKYILDAADKYNPAYLIPYDVLSNDAFIVDAERGGWITLTDDNDLWKNVVSVFGEITSEAIMKGEATVSSSGYCKNPRVKDWKENKAYFKEYFSKEYTGIKVDSIEVANEDDDTMPLEQKIEFSLPINSSGGYKYFTINLFQGLEKNPFIADERKTDIEFNYMQSYTLVGNFTIPDDYEFDELPKNIKMVMPDSSIVLKRMLQADNNSLSVKINLDFLQPFYTAETYPLLQEFYKKLFATLNEQVVIKKKKS